MSVPPESVIEARRLRALLIQAALAYSQHVSRDEPERLTLQRVTLHFRGDFNSTKTISFPAYPGGD